VSLVSNLSASAENPLKAVVGTYTLNQALNEPPSLSAIIYVATLEDVPDLGSDLTFGNYDFYLTTYSYKESPQVQKIGNAVVKYEVSLTYSHVSKLFTEKGINTAKFVLAYGGSAQIIGEQFYRFPLSGLLAQVSAFTGINCPITGLSGFVNLPYRPANTDFFTLRSFLDERSILDAKVAVFSPSGIDYVTLGTGRAVTSEPLTEITLNDNETPCYKNTLLNWNGGTNYALQNTYVQVTDDEYVLYDGDPNPHLPPVEVGDGTLVPRDLSVFVDNGGLSKQFKITLYKYGQPNSEISGTYGFSHSALELVSNPLAPLNIDYSILNRMQSNPAAQANAFGGLLKDLANSAMGMVGTNIFARPIVWRVTSIKQTDFIYQNLDLNIKPQVKDSNGNYVATTVPSQFDNLLKCHSQVLVAEQSEGWAVKRFANEDAANWSKGSIEAWIRLTYLLEIGSLVANDPISLQYYYLSVYKAKCALESFLYRKIPITERVDYFIEPFSKYYKDGDKVDWNVEYIPKSQLPDVASTQDPVAVLFPSPDWVPNLMIVAKSRYSISAGVSGNPEYNDQAASLWGKNPIYLTTGEEIYEHTRYMIRPSKTTKPNIDRIYETFNDLGGLLTSIHQNQNYSGTFYRPFSYMNVPDNAVIGTGVLPSIDVNKVIATQQKKDPDTIPSYSTASNDASFKDDSYSIYGTIRTVADASFKGNIQSSSFSTALGRPPSATVRKPVNQLNPKQDKDGLKDSLTYLTSNVRDRNILSDVTITGANNIQEALKGAAFKLHKDVFDGASLSTSFTWTQNAVKPNSVFQYFGQKWAAKSSTFTTQIINGGALSQPVSVTFGEVIPVTLTTVNTTVPALNTIKGGLVTTVEVSGLPSNIGNNLDSLPYGYGRWVNSGSSGL
jgi:hypothetical protein